MAKKPTPAEEIENLKGELLLREAQEEVRRDQMEKLWKAYAPYIVGGALVVLAVIGGYQFTKQRAAEAAAKAGDAYARATQSGAEGKLADARKSFTEMAKSGSGGYQALAAMQGADAAIKAEKPNEAVALLDQLANDSSADPILRDAARIKAATLRVDTAPWTEIQNRLTPLQDASSPWRFSARELFGLAAFKAGKYAEAKQSFQALIGDPQAPPSLRQRAEVVISQIIAAELAAKVPANVSPDPKAPAPTETKPAEAKPAEPKAETKKTP